MDKTFDDYKVYAEDFLQHYYGVPTTRNFRCINPLHDDSKPSMGYDKEKCRAHCFGCEASYDIFDLVGLYFNITDKGEQFKKVQELYGGGYSTPLPPKPKKKVQTEEDKQKNAEKIKKYIQDAILNAYRTDYFQKRGFNSDTVHRCNLGYDPEEDAIVIPYSKQFTYYQRRYCQTKKFYKPKLDEAGHEPLYNAQALRIKTRKPVFIVESPLCAISIMQCGGQAVALGGCGAEKLFKLVKEKKPLGTLILALDNDDTGVANTEKIRDKFQELDVKFIIYNIAGTCKDPNELLQKDEKLLSENIGKAIKEAKKLTATKFDSIPLEELLKMKFPPRVWLIDKLVSTGLTILASPSKFGKSWMVLQMMQAIVEGKDFLGFPTHQYDVEYMALEDDPARIVERTLKQRSGKPIKSGCYISNKAPTLDNETLIDVMAEKLDDNPNLKLFIIDTLQKVRKKKRKEGFTDYAVDYEEIGELKDFADDNKIAIIVVHHTRKTKDESDPFADILGSTALQGVVDGMIVLGKKNETTIMHFKGRDVPDDSRIIEFDDDKKGGTCTWKIVGTPEEQEKMLQDQLYNKNPIVITIKELLKMNPNGWSGNSTEFLQAVYDVTKQVLAMNTTYLGREINELHMRLYADGIMHTYKTTAKKRVHTFTYVSKYKPWQQNGGKYQTDINDYFDDD